MKRRDLFRFFAGVCAALLAKPLSALVPDKPQTRDLLLDQMSADMEEAWRNTQILVRENPCLSAEHIDQLENLQVETSGRIAEGSKEWDVLEFNGQLLFPMFGPDGSPLAQRIFYAREDDRHATPGYYRAVEWPSLKRRADLKIFHMDGLPLGAVPRKIVFSAKGYPVERG